MCFCFVPGPLDTELALLYGYGAYSGYTILLYTGFTPWLSENRTPAPIRAAVIQDAAARSLNGLINDFV